MTIDEPESGRRDNSTLSIRISRKVRIPDALRLARYHRAPELGPAVLFFSGGTALNPLSRRLTDYTHNSIHLVTPFDSGGSSAKLRDAFHMLSVGDLRSRLMALANQTVTGSPEIYRLFSYRFPKDAHNGTLRGRLEAMVAGDERLVADIPDPMRKLVRNHLRFFQEQMPDDFDLRGASIGNLILVGGYLNNDRHIDPVVYMFSKLVEALGTVRTVVNADMHLAARLDDGRAVIGQRNLTGKEVPPLKSTIDELYLVVDVQSGKRAEADIRQKTADLIARAELICYPMGSFYSSVIANLLPVGVAESIAANSCPKVYIPNTGSDPEQYGRSVADCAKQLLHYLCVRGIPANRVLDFVIVDSKHGEYASPVDVAAIEGLGVKVIDTNLVNDTATEHIDPEKLLGVILSLT